MTKTLIPVQGYFYVMLFWVWCLAALIHVKSEHINLVLGSENHQVLFTH